MKSENAIQSKSYSFALRIVKLYRFLCDEKREFLLSKIQLLAFGMQHPQFLIPNF